MGREDIKWICEGKIYGTGKDFVAVCCNKQKHTVTYIYVCNLYIACCLERKRMVARKRGHAGLGTEALTIQNLRPKFGSIIF